MHIWLMFFKTVWTKVWNAKLFSNSPSLINYTALRSFNSKKKIFIWFLKGLIKSNNNRGERIVFWGPNTNTNSIRPKKNTEYEYEYYSSIFFYRIRIRIIFVKIFPTNTNTNTIRQKISTEYEYEYYSVWKYHRIRIRIISYSNIFEYIQIYSNTELFLL